MTEAAVNFFIVGETLQFAFRRMSQVPHFGDQLVFAETRYRVISVEWCMDADATEIGTRVNIEMKRIA